MTIEVKSKLFNNRGSAPTDFTSMMNRVISAHIDAAVTGEKGAREWLQVFADRGVIRISVRDDGRECITFDGYSPSTESMQEQQDKMYEAVNDYIENGDQLDEFNKIRLNEQAWQKELRMARKRKREGK